MYLETFEGLGLTQD
jgi:aromatic ring hydroxylase